MCHTYPVSQLNRLVNDWLTSSLIYLLNFLLLTRNQSFTVGFHSRSSWAKSCARKIITRSIGGNSETVYMFPFICGLIVVSAIYGSVKRELDVYKAHDGEILRVRISRKLGLKT